MIEKKQSTSNNKEMPKALQKNKSKKKFVFIILAIIWCIVIFAFSDMPSDESNSKSKGTINKAIEETLEVTNGSGITNKHPSEKRMNIVINKLNGPLRKCMHASVYFVLATLVFWGLKAFGLKGWKISILPIIICFIYAYTDEFHQSFINGRSSEFIDVIIDTIGAVIGIIIVNIILGIVNKIKKRASSENVVKN